MGIEMIHLQPASNPVEKQEPSAPFHRGMFRVVKFYRYTTTPGPTMARITMPEEAFGAFVRFTVKQRYDFHPRVESWWMDDGTVEVKVTEQLLEKIQEHPFAGSQWGEMGRYVEVNTKGIPINRIVPINIGPIV